MSSDPNDQTPNKIPQPPGNDGFLGSFAGEAEDQLTGHSYDGIQEYDNPLPGWWKWLFVASILFFFPYFAFYHSGNESRSLEARYSAASAANARLQFAEIGELDGDEATLVKYLNDSTWVRVGQSVYKANCTSCHGADGGGLVGPNLRDEAYKNIRLIEDIYEIVNNGAAAGAMPAWKNRLDQNERVLVAAYVASLRGTDEGGGKAAEGRPIPPWPEYVEPEASESEESGSGEAKADESESEASASDPSGGAEDRSNSNGDAGSSG